MKSRTLFRLSASAAMLTLTTVGCKPASVRPAAIASVAPSAARDADRAATRAADAIAARDAARAVEQAEAAVTLSPRDAAKRALLGQAYLIAGRFGSARAAFRDSLALDPAQPRVMLNLALSEVATGDARMAHDRLTNLAGQLPAGDLGLAYALTGDTGRATDLLETAARSENADGRVRQNLALAYALAGRWAEARATAAQDLPADQINRRMLEWAMLAQPRTSWDQLAGVLAVKPHFDPGQPVALALAPLAAPTPVMPQAAPAALAVVTPAAAAAPQVDIARIEPAPAPVAAAEPPAVAAAAPVPVARFDAPETTEYAAAPQPRATPAVLTPAVAATPKVAPPPLIAAPQQPIKVAYVAPVRATPAVAQPAVHQGHGNYVVQLGAYSAAARVETAWNRIAQRVRMVADYTPSSSSFELEQVGTVYRLSLAGFATRADAVDVCERVRAGGGECFVRAAANERPVRWVSRKAERSEQLALR